MIISLPSGTEQLPPASRDRSSCLIRRGSRARISLRSAIEATKRPTSACASASFEVQARSQLIGIAASIVSISASVGIAVEHSSREATMAPAALAYCSTFSSGQPASSPWHSDPPKESPAPRPFSGWIGIGGDSTRSVRVLASTPLGPCLTIGQLDPGGQQRVGGPLRLGLADRDLALLAVADGDGHVRQRPLHLLGGLRRASPRTSAGSPGRAR